MFLEEIGQGGDAVVREVKSQLTPAKTLASLIQHVLSINAYFFRTLLRPLGGNCGVGHVYDSD